MHWRCLNRLIIKKEYLTRPFIPKISVIFFNPGGTSNNHHHTRDTETPVGWVISIILDGAHDSVRQTWTCFTDKHMDKSCMIQFFCHAHTNTTYPILGLFGFKHSLFLFIQTCKFIKHSNMQDMKSQANYNLFLCLLEEIGKSVVDSIQHLNKHWSRNSQTLTDQSKQTSISMCRFQYSIVKFITQTRGQGSLNVKVQVVYVTEEVFAPKRTLTIVSVKKILSRQKTMPKQLE